MDNLTVSQIWKYFKWLPPFILRSFFPKERLSNLILLDVRPRHQAVHVNLGEIARYDIWLKLTNITPFNLELDRISTSFNCCGINLRTHSLDRTQILSGESIEIFLEGSINENETSHISRHSENSSFMELNAEFNCSLHNFSKHTGSLDGINVHYLNPPKQRPSVQ